MNRTNTSLAFSLKAQEGVVHIPRVVLWLSKTLSGLRGHVHLALWLIINIADIKTKRI